MHGRKLKIGAGLLATAAIIAFVAPSSAFADYAPASGDVVGVGSDTLQALGDFVADGDYVSDPGFNSAGNKFKLINVDATADANTRLAYGPGGANGLGAGGSTPQCAPGTGAKIGTGNLSTPDTNTADLPCVLAPTVVLRAGLAPEQRPNGSGAGFKLLNADTNQTTGAAIGNSGKGLVNFSRASSSQVNGSNTLYNSVTVGTDTLAMLSAAGTATAPTNAVAVTAAQLTAIYQCTTTNWSAVGGTAGTILPLLPQVGSGTRKTFLAAISVTTPGSCVQNVEENDPEAIQDSSSPVNAIEPMSGSRLNLFLGEDNTGTSLSAKYFQDPSCPFNPTTSSLAGVAGTSNAPAACQGAAAAVVPHVKFWNTGTAFTSPRNLLIYFRAADLASTTPFQPGGTLNWLRTLFYNPCPVAQTDPNFIADGCSFDSTHTITFGKGGAPYFATFAGQTDIAAAGVTPKYTFNGVSQ